MPDGVGRFTIPGLGAFVGTNGVQGFFEQCFPAVPIDLVNEDEGAAAKAARELIVSRKDVMHVVLFEPEIPPNTGNIGRMCWATNSPLHLIRPLGFDIDDKAVRRAGLDYWKELDLVVWDTFEELCALVAASRGGDPRDRMHYFTTRGERSHWDARFESGDFLVFGPETRGLPASMIESNGGRCVKIPMVNGRSLNLATSAGIGLYEALRQRGLTPGECSTNVADA